MMQRGAEMQDQKSWTEFSNTTMLQQPGELWLDTGKWQLIMQGVELLPIRNNTELLLLQGQSQYATLTAGALHHYHDIQRL